MGDAHYIWGTLGVSRLWEGSNVEEERVETWGHIFSCSAGRADMDVCCSLMLPMCLCVRKNRCFGTTIVFRTE